MKDWIKANDDEALEGSLQEADNKGFNFLHVMKHHYQLEYCSTS